MSSTGDAAFAGVGVVVAMELGIARVKFGAGSVGEANVLKNAQAVIKSSANAASNGFTHDFMAYSFFKLTIALLNELRIDSAGERKKCSRSAAASVRVELSCTYEYPDQPDAK